MVQYKDLDFSDTTRALEGGTNPFFDTGGSANGNIGHNEIVDGKLRWTMEADPERTAQTGTLASAVLDAGASASDDFYNGMSITVVGVTRTILDYDGATRTVYVSGWGSNLAGGSVPTPPGSSSAFSISDGGTPARSGTCQAGGTNPTLTLASAASSEDDYYNLGAAVILTGGTGSGQFGRVADYDGATRVATLYTWEASGTVVKPDNTSDYVAGYWGGAGPGRRRLNTSTTNTPDAWMGPWSYQYHERVLYSVGFQGHASGVNKYLYHHEYSAGAGPYIGFNFNQGAADEGLIELQLQHGTSNARVGYNHARNTAGATQAQATITAGVEFSFETEYYPGTGKDDGTFRCWLDNDNSGTFVLVIEVTDVDIYSQADGDGSYTYLYVDNAPGGVPATVDQSVRGHRLDPVWGGVKDVVLATQYLEVGRVYVSGGGSL